MQQIKSRTFVKQFSRRAVNLSHWSPPTRNVTDEDGAIVTEKIPSIPHALMLHPQGHVIRLPLHNGMGLPADNDPYKMDIVSKKLAKGWLPYGQCPKRLGLVESLPKKVRSGEPCKLDAEGSNPVSDSHPCACVVAAKDARQARNSAAMSEIEERYKSRQQRDSERQMDAISSLADAVKVVKEAGDSRGGGGGGGRRGGQ